MGCDVWPYLLSGVVFIVVGVVFFFRVIEDDDGWCCRRGRDQLDEHDTLSSALTHIRELAKGDRPSLVVVHHANGWVVPDRSFD